MISHSIKKNIRLIAEKYGYTITYEKDIIKLMKDDFHIEIASIDKYSLLVKYNDKNIAAEVNVEPEFVYHVVLKLFDYGSRNLPLLNWKFTELLTIQEYYKVENFSEKEISARLDMLKETNADYEGFGGNLIVFEYYKGIIILTDDLNIYNWNVVEWA